MDEERTYTLDEVEERTGFDKRTIAYYVQEGLLPKVGRRGPRTRYSRQFLDRLLFIKKTRDLQDQGLMGSMTLGEIKDLFDEVPDWTIHNIVTGKEPLQVVDNRWTQRGRPRALSSPRARAKAAARRIGALHEEVQKDSEPAEVPCGPVEAEKEGQPADAMRIGEALEEGEVPDLDGVARFSLPSAKMLAPPPPPVEEELRRVLLRLVRASKASPSDRRKPTERWTRARVASEIFLSAEDLDEDHEHLLEEAARLLKRLMLEVDEDRH